jgi:thiol-disulfide isomerase/thioredoxin
MGKGMQKTLMFFRTRLLQLGLAALLPAVALCVFGGSGPVRAFAPITTDKAIIYLFWGDGCPHCAAEKPFLEDLARRFPKVELRMYEVWNDRENQDIFRRMAAAHGFEPQSVPTTFVGSKYWEGFSATIQQEIKSAVASCLSTGCPDAGLGVIGRTPSAVSPPEAACETCASPRQAATPYSVQSNWISNGLTALVVIGAAAGFLALAFAIGRAIPSGAQTRAAPDAKPDPDDREDNSGHAP